MMQYWKVRARENGLSGIYFAEMLTAFKNSELKSFDARILFEPMYTIAHELPPPRWKHLRRLYRAGMRRSVYRVVPKPKKTPDSFDYDKIWKLILRRKPSAGNVAQFAGAFVDWDNTPRRRERGWVISGGGPTKFGKYFSALLRKAKSQYKTDYVFINAWNEWAEGAHLEPDEKYGFANLEKIKSALERL
jgi:hypothetical protein